ncbi:RdgB/HAM1 family non-canonical purine NTP pyrophosphatase [Candidatus Gottesmanbacteria bacterium]|nr:RdgB/HAM1 family non-canonical purine NTP pyrophosphatase [Candidatus Gottesmanbacteria bacterium]
MRQLLIATRNPGKVREIKDILQDISYEIKSLDDIGYKENVEETGKSYEENAILKAKTIGKETNLLTIGEDSGLEIDMLEGWPAIHSARHTLGTDDDKIDKILEKLSSVPREKRTARYKSVIALYDPVSHKVQTFDGSCEGYITEKRIGKNGFGYDPIFWSKDLGKTFGQAEDREKNRISHRARALLKLKKILNTKVSIENHFGGVMNSDE